MIVKYKIDLNGDEITRVEVLRETPKMVFLKDQWGSGIRGIMKKSSYGNYFDTWDEAHASILRKARARVAATQSSLDRHNKRMEYIKGMKAP